MPIDVMRLTRGEGSGRTGVDAPGSADADDSEDGFSFGEDSSDNIHVMICGRESLPDFLSLSS